MISAATARVRSGTEPILLPPPEPEGGLSIEAALHQRRSVRAFAPAALAFKDVAQLLWAAQGMTDARGFRTAPSAGALYPLEVYLAAGAVEQLHAGVYHYDPIAHAVSIMLAGDQRAALSRATLGQTWLRDAAAALVICAVYRRTMAKYGERGIRYAQIEVGHAAQNVYLQAVSLGLGTVMVGAFDDDQVRTLLGMTDDCQPLGIMPIGKPG